MIIYVDESGFRKDWVFVAVKIPSERDAQLCIKKWRHYASSVSTKFAVNEYRDCKTPDNQRERILKEIAAMSFKFWVLHFFNYRSHKRDFSKAVLMHIPAESGHPFRFKPDTHSNPFRTPIPK